MEFSGRLTSFPIAELLTWAHNDRRTGALIVRRSSREKQIFFRQGLLVGATSDATGEFFGRHLLLEGLLDQNQLLEALTLCKSRQERLGVVLHDEGMLDAESVQDALNRHLRDLVCDIFLWRHGIFYFESGAPPADDGMSHPPDVLQLVVEGARWCDELARIETTVTDNAVVKIKRAELAENVRQRLIIKAVDNKKTLRLIFREVGGSYFRFMNDAHRLVRSGAVEVIDVGDGDFTSLEIPLFDLLLEQAAEEQVLFSKKHFAIPLEVLARFVPLWVREPEGEEWERMPADAKRFYERFDGSQPLTEIFSEDRGARARETELLLLQMRKAAVGLMPASIQQLEDEAAERRVPEQKRWWKRLFSALSS